MPRLKSVGTVSSNPPESLPKSLKRRKNSLTLVRSTASPPPNQKSCPNLSTASPPPPLRMERGVNSIVCKQRGHLFDAKERLSSIRRNALFVLRMPFPNRLPLGTPPLGGGWVGLFHSERGRGWGYFSSFWGTWGGFLGDWMKLFPHSLVSA